MQGLFPAERLYFAISSRLSHNDVKRGFEMLDEIELALEKCRANHMSALGMSLALPQPVNCIFWSLGTLN